MVSDEEINELARDIEEQIAKNEQRLRELPTYVPRNDDSVMSLEEMIKNATN